MIHEFFHIAAYYRERGNVRAAAHYWRLATTPAHQWDWRDAA